MSSILGIDEVGRGPWAGPLVIGACVLNPRFDGKGNEIEAETWQDDLNDSKKLTAKKREKLAPIIKKKAKATGLGWVSAKELDEIGLAEALKLATRRAVCELIKKSTGVKLDENTLKSLPEKLPFDEIIIDGTQNFLKDTDLENLVSVLPKADLKIKEVSAASIIAKVARDNYMVSLAEKYPGYGFESHVGYGTALHKSALEKLGPCPEHRRSFKPVAEACKVLSGKISDATSRPLGRGERSDGVVTASDTPVTNQGSDEMRACSASRSDVDSDTKCQTGVARGVSRKEALHASTAMIGHRAEGIVADYLLCHGHTILARNYKTKFYEIDIISATKDHIYFTEVKYRKNVTHGTPLEFIDAKKQQQITFAANAFMKYLSKKLGRSIDDLPSPILAAAAVSGPDFTLDKWLELVV